MELQNGANNRTRIYVNESGALYMWGNSELDMARISDGFYGQYIYLYGKMTVSGDGTYNPLLNNLQRINCYEQQNNDTYVNDIWRFENCRIGGASIANGYTFYMTPIGKCRSHVFKSITADGSLGNWSSSATNRLFYWPYFADGFSNIVMEDIVVKNFGYASMDYVSLLYYKNWTMENMATWRVYNIATCQRNVYKKFYSVNYKSNSKFGQFFSLYDNCTFGTGANENMISVSFGANVCLKDCIWLHTSAGNSIESLNAANVLMWGNNQFSGGREVYNIQYNGSVQWVNDLKLKVVDSNGNPISGANVSIEQNEKKEFFMFETDTNGDLNAIHGIKCALLTNIHQYGSNKATDIEYWSSSSNETYHNVIITKPGYIAFDTQVTMDTSISITATLIKKAAHSLTF